MLVRWRDHLSPYYRWVLGGPRFRFVSGDREARKRAKTHAKEWVRRRRARSGR